MSWCHGLLAGALVVVFAGPAPASQLFGKKAPKVNPTQRVPELIVAVQQDPDERKRSSAAEELRQYNAQEFPDILVALVEALKKETSTGVRLDEVSTLAKIRPATKTAREALENAANHDANWRVRLSARSSLMFYHVPAEPVTKNPQGPVLSPSTGEPPLFDPSAGVRRPAPTPAIPVSNPKQLQVAPTRPPINPGPTGPPPLATVPPLLPQQPAVAPGPDEGPLLGPPPRQ